ncbi:hypothetical protein [Allomuricauda sp. SCSIO 65647]|uniref:hypothetical protein n=1 Tax=Allomuricauda sp. SCSIO 65647 TaxID=2908843 RepID=UPI001F371BED|nr:hypothetical protein [Muricauda sp. SCSIO 65647]UJH67522.1 hypothetical protein L0P89_16430 [Muricauda sp. SCSIO 65647]
MKHFYKGPLVRTLIALAIVSCESTSIEGIENIETDESLGERKEFMKETSLLMGRVLADRDVRNEVVSKMAEIDSYGELASFSYLLGERNVLRKNEVKLLNTDKASFSKGKSLFRQKLIDEVVNNIEEYDYISSQLTDRNVDVGSISSKSNQDEIGQELAQILVNEELQIYLPYEDKIIAGKGSEDVFYVTYDPLEYTKTNEAFKYDPSISSGMGPTLQPIGPVDDDFLDDHQVFVLSPIDSCDIDGRKCSYEELFPVRDEERNDIHPPFAKGPKLLTYNVNHKDIEEDDIISTVMPRFRVKGKDWLGFAATHQRIEVFRGSPDGKISVRGGAITAESNVYKIGYFRFRKKGVKKGWWHKVNREFDADWNMSENEQVITIFSKHRLRGEVAAELNTKAGLKLVNGKVMPVAEATISSKVKISVGGAKLRGKVPLTRRQVLSTIIGNGITNETYTDGGVKYNVKKVGIFSYYLKHYYTNL